MKLNIQKITLQVQNIQVQGLMFIPEKIKDIKALGIFTHGYTSHKGTLLNWSSHLIHENIPSLIFDLPGHFLGSFHEIDSLSLFEQYTPNLFLQAYNLLKKETKLKKEVPIVLGGHSLGGLLALKAIEKLSTFQTPFVSCLCVGLGIKENDNHHPFQAPLYKNIMNVRSQLVSKNINPEIMFPWIHKTKINLRLSDRKIHVITGMDDVIMRPEDAKRLFEKLVDLNNKVHLITPKHLPHNQPEWASSYIRKYFKDLLNS